MAKTRTHVVLPSDLIDEIDDLVGSHGRSHFLADAAAEKLERMKRLQWIEAFAGSLSADAHPEWATSESTAAWVHNLRREGDRPIPDLSNLDHEEHVSS